MRTLVQAAQSEAVKLVDSVERAIELAGRAGSETEQISSSDGIALDLAMARAGNIADLSATLLDKGESAFELLGSTARLKALAQKLSAVTSHVDRLSGLLKQVVDAGGIQQVNKNGILTAADGTNLNPRETLDLLTADTDRTIEPYINLASVVRPRNVGTFSAAAKSLAKKSREASDTAKAFQSKLDEMSKQMSDKLQELNERSTAAKENVSHVDRAKAEIEQLRDEIRALKDTAEENQQKTAAALAASEQERSKAAALSAEVTEYQDRFDAFKKLLDEREEALKTGNTDLEKLRTKLADQKTEIDRLNGQASEMLGSATIAGLSSTYETRASRVDEQLTWANRLYYAAVAFLVLSVLTALNLLALINVDLNLPAMPSSTDRDSAGAVAIRTFAGLGSRLLIVLPALLLLSFASKRQSALFRLREEYSHKAALAASINGFKKQAPQFEEPMAAAVFQELLSNPAHSMDVTKEPKRNGFLDRLITPRVNEALEKMLEKRDAA